MLRTAYVHDRYLHHRPLIFTTNKPLAAWGRVLHDPDLAEAILDRVLERGRHLDLRGPSYRTRHLKLDLHHDSEPRSSAPARISGNHRPEFPRLPQPRPPCPPVHLRPVSNSAGSGRLRAEGGIRYEPDTDGARGACESWWSARS
jgi:IstB-like ATP binding protein